MLDFRSCNARATSRLASFFAQNVLENQLCDFILVLFLCFGVNYSIVTLPDTSYEGSNVEDQNRDRAF